MGDEAKNRPDVAEDDEVLKDDDKIFRLVDLLVSEVSLVDRGANRAKWLVRKQQEQGMGTGAEVFETPDGNLTAGDDNPFAMTDPAPEPPEAGVEKPVTIPKPVKAKVMQMAEAASNRLASLLAAVKGAKTTDEKLPEPVPAAVGKKIKDIASLLRGIESKYPSPRAARAGSEKALVIPGPVQNKLMVVLEQVSNRLASVIAQVKGAQETDEDLPKPLPAVIGKEIEALAVMLDGLTEKYPSPKSAAAGVDDSEGGEAVDEAIKLMTAALAKLEPGKPADQQALQDLAKARDLLGEEPAPASKSEPDNPQDEPAAGDGEVEKRGTKMSRERRKRFRDALKILSDLFAEVDPEAAKAAGSWPSRASKAQVEKSAGDETKVSKLEKRASEAEERLNAAEVELKKVRQELAAEMRRAQPSNVADVPSAPDEDEAAPAGGCEWPADLNDPGDW